MLDQKRVLEELEKNGVDFFVGVPDSYLNGFCNYALQNCPEKTVIAANEGNAVGIAAGHYFATRELPLVYMQCSTTLLVAPAHKSSTATIQSRTHTPTLPTLHAELQSRNQTVHSTMVK